MPILPNIIRPVSNLFRGGWRGARLKRPIGGLIAALTLVIAPAAAQADDEVLRFAQTVFSMGAIDDSQTQLHAFSFVNVTNRRVRVAMGYCHLCTPPVLDKDVLNPGESGTVVLELNPAGRKGPISVSATLAEEGRTTSAVNIEFRAEVCPRVWVEPVNMFPRIVKGEGATATFSVTGRKADFKVLKIDSDAALDGVDIGPVSEVADCGATARRQDVTIHFPHDAPLGPWAARFKVVTNDEQADPKLVSVDGQVVGKIGYEPAVVGARIAPGEIFLRTFEVVASDATAGALIIDSAEVTASDEATGVALDVAPTRDPSRVRVTVSGHAPLRTRQAVNIKLRFDARTLGSTGSEALEVPVTLVVSRQR